MFLLPRDGHGTPGVFRLVELLQTQESVQELHRGLHSDTDPLLDLAADMSRSWGKGVRPDVGG